MKEKKRTIINSIREIPRFKSEDEERAWWADHDFSENFYKELRDTTSQLDEALPLPRRRTSKRLAHG